jgi:hypothetical protein
MAILQAVVCLLVGIAHAAPATIHGHPQLRQALAPRQCSIFPLLLGDNMVSRLRGGGDDGVAQVQQEYDEIPVHVLTDLGREAIGEKKYGEAADYFSAALGRNVDKYGELATECAELYYLYGSALALEAEETDDNLFGPSVPARLPVEQVLITEPLLIAISNCACTMTALRLLSSHALNSPLIPLHMRRAERCQRFVGGRRG